MRHRHKVFSHKKGTDIVAQNSLPCKLSSIFYYYHLGLNNYIDIYMYLSTSISMSICISAYIHWYLKTFY